MSVLPIPQLASFLNRSGFRVHYIVNREWFGEPVTAAQFVGPDARYHVMPSAASNYQDTKARIEKGLSGKRLSPEGVVQWKRKTLTIPKVNLAAPESALAYLQGNVDSLSVSRTNDAVVIAPSGTVFPRVQEATFRSRNLRDAAGRLLEILSDAGVGDVQFVTMGWDDDGQRDYTDEWEKNLKTSTFVASPLHLPAFLSRIADTLGPSARWRLVQGPQGGYGLTFFAAPPGTILPTGVE